MRPRRFDPCFVLPALVLTLVFVFAVVGGVVTAFAGADLIAGALRQQEAIAPEGDLR